MSGGIEWFRWHHGSVTDPKFQLVARMAKCRLPDVLAVWAFILERASASDVRGSFGSIDAESVDCLFDLADGTTASILVHMVSRELIADGRVLAWEKRQPKREREDDGAAQRKREQRAREIDDASRHVTPRHATSRQKTPRVEESREENKEHPPTPHRLNGGPSAAPPDCRFEEFWETWPKSSRKQDKKKCLAKWRRGKYDLQADVIIAHVITSKASKQWVDGYEPAPMTYLNGERWNDGTEVEPVDPMAWRRDPNTVIARGEELGVKCRPGELINAYTDRVVRAHFARQNSGAQA